MKESKSLIDNRSYLSLKLSLTTIVILSVIFGFYIHFSSRDMVAAMDKLYKERALAVISKASIAIGNRYNLNDKEYVKWVCDDLVEEDSSVKEVSIFAVKNGKDVIRVASSNPEQSDNLADPQSIAPIRTGKITWTEISNNRQEHIVEVLAPLYMGDKPEASISVRMNVKPKDNAINQYMLRALLYALAGLLAIAPILYRATKREVFDPLAEVIAGAQEISKGNLDKRINVNRRDELGMLSQEFNNMSERLKQKEEENRQQLEEITEKWVETEEKSRTDLLTGLVNHRSFHANLAGEINRASRQNLPVSLLFGDLDKFKMFNDINGHLLGDKALFEIAEIINKSVRNYDVAARYGGEEFAVILPNTDSSNAMIVAERIRSNVAAHQFTTKDGTGQMTISIGIATYPKDVENKDALVVAADFAMYESKKKGGNATSFYKEPESDS